MILNQVDKIEPFREWDIKNHKPSQKQADNIKNKITEEAKYFDIANSKVIPVSANEKYNLVTLVDEIVFSLPAEKIITLAKSIDKEFISEKAKGYIKSSSANYIMSVAASGASIGAVVGRPIGAVVGGMIGGAVGWV